ncbi:MAG TPA: hypothetical protein VF752_08165 [Thermoleophilaceae bacterium]
MTVVWVAIAVVVLVVLGALVVARTRGITRTDARERMADTAADFRDWIRLGR